jgi:hypothetical protein
MASYFTTSIATGQRLFVTDADPNIVISATRGSIALRVDAGNVALYLNTDNATAWDELTSVSPTGTVDWQNVAQVLLADNSATALDIGSTGALNLLEFVTTNGAERLTYNGAVPLLVASGGLTVSAGSVSLPEASLNVASATTDAADLSVTAGLFISVNHPAGAGFQDVVLPARVGGWRVVDSYILSGGAAAGSVQVQTAGGLANISNTMNPGAAAGAVTRATGIDLTNGTVASGATIRVNVAAGANAGTCFIRIEPR